MNENIPYLFLKQAPEIAFEIMVPLLLFVKLRLIVDLNLFTLLDTNYIVQNIVGKEELL